MHNDIIDTIRLDITRSSTNVCVYVRTADTRTLEFFLTNNGNIVDLTGSNFAAMYIEKNGIEYYQTVSRIGNKLRYTLHDEEVAKKGEASCRLVISFKDDTQITSPIFTIIVEEIPAMSNAVINTEEYTESEDAKKYSAITSALAASIEYAEKCEEKVSEATQLLTDSTQIFANIQQLLESTDALVDIINGIVPIGIQDVDAMWEGTYDSSEEEEE